MNGQTLFNRLPTLPFLLLLLLALLWPAACASVATETAGQTAAMVTATEPSALAVVTPSATLTSPPPSPTILIYAYPGAPGHTPTPNPYPLGTPTPTITWTPGPTWTPEPTEPPVPTVPTDPPLPTLGPTPVVTVIPTAAPPLIPFPAGTTAQPFTIYYRQGDAIYTLSSAEGAAPQLFLDPLAEFGHMLPPSARLVSDWGAWSPDGQSLALVLTDDPVVYAIPNTDSIFVPAPHPTDLYLFDVAGRELRLLAADGFLPVWSPDGRRVAYRSTDTLGLWVADVASGVAKEVYAVPPPVYGYDPPFADWYRWAYDSHRLVVLETDFSKTHKWTIVDADGLAAPRPVDEDPRRSMMVAQWSPRDDRLAYIQPGPMRQPLYELWIMNGDLTGRVQLTHDLTFYGYGPAWSPDGRWIVISGLASYEAEYISYDLWLVEPDSAAVYRLTYDTPVASYEELVDAHHDGPQLLWSPDGTQLVYSKGSQQLWLMSLLDGSRRQLLQSEESLYDSGIIVGP